MGIQFAGCDVSRSTTPIFITLSPFVYYNIARTPDASGTPGKDDHLTW